MTDLEKRYSHFRSEIKRLEEYESKGLFKKLFSSNKPNEEVIIKSLNIFVTKILINEIPKFNDIETFKSSFNWYNSIKGFLYPETIFEILNSYQELPFLDQKTYNLLENYKMSLQMQIQEAEKLDDMLNNFR